MHRTSSVTLLSFTLLLAGLAVAQQPLQSGNQRTKDASSESRQSSRTPPPDLSQGQIDPMKDLKIRTAAVAAADDPCKGMTGDALSQCRGCQGATNSNGKTWVDSKGKKHRCNE
jgi:hypothetical protein